MTQTLTPTVDFVDSTPIIDDPEALRARAAVDGYLFFKGLLPADDVLNVRRQMLQALADRGWLAAGIDLMDGIVDRAAFARVTANEHDFCGVGLPPEAYRAIQHIEDFHRLAHHSRLLQVYGNLFGKPVFPHPRNIARVMIPADKASPTPPHQDFIHIQGTKNVWTAWFPLGDCPVELGGLAALAGSQRDGLLSYKAASGPGGLEAYLCDLDYPWATGHYAAGDVLTFSCQTVHRATPNHYADRIRLSCDYRYQPADEDIHESSLKVHCEVDEWESIYADWRDDSLKYYWQRRDLRLSDWDETIRWQKDKIC